MLFLGRVRIVIVWLVVRMQDVRLSRVRLVGIFWRLP